MRGRIATLALMTLVVAAIPVAGAQNLDMRNTGSARADDGRPSRGMTQASVESKFGTPVSKGSPVGEPPITRWDYQEFVVYFEYDRVIHAVLKR